MNSHNLSLMIVTFSRRRLVVMVTMVVCELLTSQ